MYTIADLSKLNTEVAQAWEENQYPLCYDKIALARKLLESDGENFQLPSDNLIDGYDRDLIRPDYWRGVGLKVLDAHLDYLYEETKAALQKNQFEYIEEGISYAMIVINTAQTMISMDQTKESQLTFTWDFFRAELKYYLGRYKEAHELFQELIENENSKYNLKAYLSLVQVQLADGCYLAAKNSLAIIQFLFDENQDYYHDRDYAELQFTFLYLQGVLNFETQPVLEKDSAESYFIAALEFHNTFCKKQFSDLYPMLLLYLGREDVTRKNWDDANVYFDRAENMFQVEVQNHFFRVNLLIARAELSLERKKYRTCNKYLKEAEKMIFNLLPEARHPYFAIVELLKAESCRRSGFNQYIEIALHDAAPHLVFFTEKSEHPILKLKQELETLLSNSLPIIYRTSQQLTQFAKSLREADAPPKLDCEFDFTFNH